MINVEQETSRHTSADREKMEM
ncbi:hypothetical protein EVA_22599, partial [gut metagenome]